MPTRLIIPILNRKVTTFPGPTWYLADGVAVEQIPSEDYGVVMGNAPGEYTALLGPKGKTLRIESVDPSSAVTRARRECTIAAFVLNFFRQKHPVAVAFALQLTKRRKTRLDDVIDLPSASDARTLRQGSYRVAPGTTRDTVAGLYKVVSAAHTKHPNILLTLGRFNSGLLRQDPHDRIVDVTVSLESLIRGTTELRHRFALHNAWAAEADAAKRGEVFRSLQALYDARSAIVHGDPMSTREYNKKIQPLLDDWDRIVKIAAEVVAYHVLFLYDNDISAWHQHQMDLSLGRTERIA